MILTEPRQVLKAAGRWQAVIVADDGTITASCGHDDHRTRRDAAGCLDRLAEATR